MIPLTYHHLWWGRSEVVTIYPDVYTVYVYLYIYWLVVSTPLKKYESQLGWLFQIYGKIKVIFQSPPISDDYDFEYCSHSINTHIWQIALNNHSNDNSPFMDHFLLKPPFIRDFPLPAMFDYQRIYLVGGFNPSEKYESQLGWWTSQYMEK